MIISERRLYESFQLKPEQGSIPNFDVSYSKRVEKDLIDWILAKKGEHRRKKAGGNGMFHNLRAEMARNGIKTKDIQELLKVSKRTAQKKLNGSTEFIRSEMFKIKKEWFNELTLEYLFEENEN